MTFEDYKIIPVSDEDSFLGELIEKTCWLGSNEGFILGEICRIIDNTSDLDVVKNLSELLETMEKYFKEQNNIHKFISEEWIRRGKPKSLRQQGFEKAAADERDRIKSEYYDR